MSKGLTSHSEVQAVLFQNTAYTAESARAWLARHGYERMKHVDKTENWLRYRITAPKYKRYSMKFVDGGNIAFVIGWNK